MRIGWKKGASGKEENKGKMREKVVKEIIRKMKTKQKGKYL